MGLNSMHGLCIGVFRNSRSDTEKGPLRGSKGRRLGQSKAWSLRFSQGGHLLI